MYERTGSQHRYFQNLVKEVEDIFDIQNRRKDMSEPRENFIFYTLSKYSAICNIPDDINHDWLSLIDETFDFIREHPNFLDDPENLLPGAINRFNEIKLKFYENY